MYAELVQHIVISLVDNPDDVAVVQVSPAPAVMLELSVHESDMGRVIGKGGRVVNAIRTVLKVLAAKNGDEVKLEIV